MPTTVTNPLSGLIDGMLQGYGLGMQLRREKMQQEAHQRAMANMDREAQLKDMEVRERSRPVHAGTVEEGPGASYDINTPGLPALPGGDIASSFNLPKAIRPVDKSRLVKVGGEDREVLSRDEQLHRRLQESSVMADAETYQNVDRARKLYEAALTTRGVDVPGYGRVLPEHADDIARLMLVQHPQQVPGRDVPYSSEVEEQRKRITARPTPTVAGRDVPYSPAVEAQRKRMKSADATPGQAAVENRFNRRIAQREQEKREAELKKDQDTLRSLEEKEAKLHAGKVKEGATQYPNSEQRNAVLAGLDLQIKGIQESKKKLIDKWQSKGGMPQQTTAAPGGGGRGAQSSGQPVRVSIDGTAYNFPNQAALDAFLTDHPEYR